MKAPHPAPTADRRSARRPGRPGLRGAAACARHPTRRLVEARHASIRVRELRAEPMRHGQPRRQRAALHEFAHLLLLRRVQVVEEVGRGGDDFGAAAATAAVFSSTIFAAAVWSSLLPANSDWNSARSAVAACRASPRVAPASFRPARRASVSVPCRGRACCRRARPSGRGIRRDPARCCRPNRVT